MIARLRFWCAPKGALLRFCISGAPLKARFCASGHATIVALQTGT